MKNLWKYLKKDKKKLYLGAILLFISAVSKLLYGYLIGQAISEVTALNIVNALIYLVIYLAFGLIIGNLLGEWGMMLLRKTEMNLSKKLNAKTYEKALKLPAYAFEERSSGEIINRITNDTETLNNSFSQLLMMIFNILGTVVIFVYICFNSWIIGVEIIVFLAILALVVKKFNPKIKKINEEIKQENDSYVSLTNETFRGIREVRTLGIKNNIFTEFTTLMKQLFNKREKDVTIEVNYIIITNTISIIFECATYITCAILMYQNTVSLAFFIAMTYYVYNFTWVIQSVTNINKTIQKVLVSLKRINEIVENKLYKDCQYGSVDLEECQGILEFKNVDFGYPNEKTILNDFNIKIEPNKKIAVIGKSGQGKSTLFNLITRLFEPNKGQILIDNQNIENLTEQSLYSNISIIRQEPFLFNRTIKENFQLVNPEITLEQIKEYCKKAYIDEYITLLPDQYDTLIGEGGVNLSGGQKQRLAIARSLSKKSKIILFDEATSALDNTSQEYIKKAINDLVKNHTVVIIAHRLSTIIDADIIYVVNDGKVIAQGTHKQLLKENKYYQELYLNES